MRSAAVVGIAVVLAFTVRVAPAYHAVFQPRGIKFLDNDSWFHMRSIHNLVAHYPSQSGFDPYALFPDGQVLYTEPWDLAVASVAWILGAGKPGDHLVDEVGAWLPAVLGALLPIPVFLLGKRLFGDPAGQLGAFTIAVIPGILLWETHLGVPDHHVAECLLALISLLCLCGAAEEQGRKRIRLTVLAGVALGVYICVRPAGIFVPGAFVVAALLEPVLVLPVIGTVAIASAVFLTSSGNKWAQYTWLSLGGSIAVCLFVWAADALWRKRRLPGAFFLPAAGVAALIALGVVAVIKPATFFALGATIRRFLPGGKDAADVSTIRELRPLWKEAPTFRLAWEALGGGWIAALPALICGIPLAWRARRPALTLFTVWGVVMIIAAFLQIRMLVYAGPVIALAAGGGVAWLIDKAPEFRVPAMLGFAAFILASNLPADIRLVRDDSLPDAQWFAALDWLNRNTPEPMGDRGAWTGLWPRLRPGEVFNYPKSAYGVLTWWDYGDWIDAIAHRLPTSNGTQVHADKIAEFLTETDPTLARIQISRLRARYVVVNPSVLGGNWPAIELWAHRTDEDYSKTFFAAGKGGKAVPVKVYMPDYYRSMAVRLYAFDGRKASAPAQLSVYITRHTREKSGAEGDVLIGERKFTSEKDASAYMMAAMVATPGENMTLGSTDPTVSCVDLEELPWAKLDFSSDETPLRKNRIPRAVKVFEVTQ